MNTYRQIVYHIVFATKYRQPTINEAHCRQLYAYIHGIVRNKGCHLYRINGVADHLHICSDLHPSVSLADFVKDIKVASCIWMKTNGLFPDFTGWQAAYGAFTVSYRDRERVIAYIKNQKEHHQQEVLLDEYAVCCRSMGCSMMSVICCSLLLLQGFNPIRGYPAGCTGG